ncbi:hypothetical protein TKK_0006847 [Trichogramma kaykai]
MYHCESDNSSDDDGFRSDYSSATVREDIAETFPGPRVGAVLRVDGSCRLPLERCRAILGKLTNEDLYNVCLAFEGQS